MRRAASAQHHQQGQSMSDDNEQQQSVCGLPNRRHLLASAATAAVAGAVGAAGGFAVPSAWAAAEAALPLVPKAALTPQLSVSRVIK
ncbi:hypothetical protein MNEG_14754, partial [Monoraphidium neglectum]